MRETFEKLYRFQDETSKQLIEEANALYEHDKPLADYTNNYVEVYLRSLLHSQQKLNTLIEETMYDCFPELTANQISCVLEDSVFLSKEINKCYEVIRSRTKQ